MLLYLKPIYNVICQLYLNLKKKRKEMEFLVNVK